jgi:hypothetical protein
MKRVGVMISGQSELARGTRGRAVRTATRVERTLQRFNALPKRESDLSLIGDLSVLELHAQQLYRAIRALAASPDSLQGRRTFEDRLLDLQAQFDNVAEICRDARGPLKRLVSSRVGVDGRIESLMRGITSGMEAVGIDTRSAKKPRRR